MEQHLTASVVGAKAKMVERVARHEFQYFAFDNNARIHPASVAARSLINQRIEDGLCSR
jgi:hypothetical protein